MAGNTQGQQPRLVRAVNSGGRVLGRLGIAVPRLCPEKIIAAAQKQTGLSDFGDGSFRFGLEHLLESIEREACLSQIGRIAVRGMLVNELVSRLQLIEYRKSRPEVADGKIQRPLFVLGLARTGTTILYELLALDPNHRAPASWEVSQPVPPAQLDSFNSDPRIEEVDKVLAQTEILAPGFKAIHEVGARLPQECVSMLASHFISMQYDASMQLPTYRRWALEQDMSAAYRWHHDFLQHLQVDYSKPRWVLKSPGHLPYLGALVAQYPDAAIVQTHRDPMDMLASVCSLSCTLRRAFSDRIDPIRTGEWEVEFWAGVVQRGMAQRDAMADEEQRFFDLPFDDIISDPIAAIARLYDHFDFELSAEARQAMQTYLDQRPRDKHGTHRYHLQDFGLSCEQHGPLFKAYCERFGLA